MHIREIVARSFKRFTRLVVQELPATAKLVVMTGPNGGGKTSLFDAMSKWHALQAYNQHFWDETYHGKKGLPVLGNKGSESVEISFHEAMPEDEIGRKKIFSIRSAYRHEADFNLEALRKVGDSYSGPRVHKLIEADIKVKDNYQRIVSLAVADLFRGDRDNLSVSELRERLIGQLRESMIRVFGNLVLTGPGDPLQDGSFYFEKGASRDFHYKNLSGGEKAAFDLLLDLVVKRAAYDDTVFCIDEPELHMNTRLQAKLLEELFGLIPETCQLWIATHSIGMMRSARDLQQVNPEQVVFLDFDGKDFDQPVILRPKTVDRAFWARTLDVALGDLAELVAPHQIVLCEGKLAKAAGDVKAEFDARCYRTIFAEEFPDTDFISVGGCEEIRADRLELGRAIQAVLSGTRVLRVVDGDDYSKEEIKDLVADGVRVLSRRDLESYLVDDEVLRSLCTFKGHPEKVDEVLAAKQRAIADSTAAPRNNPVNDLKSAAGSIYTATKRILELTGCGNSAEAFLRDTLAPLLKPNMKAYVDLRNSLFGETTIPVVPPSIAIPPSTTSRPN